MNRLKVDKLVGKKASRVPLNWTARLSQCFVDLKQALAQELELFQLEPDQPFRLRTDASDAAIGAVLEQKRLDTWVPVCFYSRKLTKSQLNWPAREKETYAIVAGLWKWAGWIGTPPVEVVTDHNSLEDWAQENVLTT